MKRCMFALLTVVLLAGVGPARAAITTNLVQDFEGEVPHHILRWSGDALYDPADPANNEELLDGFATNRWMIANTAVTNNGSGVAYVTSSKDKARGLIYTITADQFSGANPNATLSFDVTDVWNLGTLYAEVYGIVNPGTSGDSVIYNVLSATPLTGTDSGSATQLGSKTIGGLADNDVPEVVTNHTVSFSYNGTDDIAVCLYVIGTGTSNKRANFDNVVVTTDDAVSFPATVSLDPSDELVMYVEDASAVATGTVSVSYVEGSPATNVTITSVSVVDQTHAGAFVNATTNLPFTLNSPAPASESLSIAFDNSTAGLTDDQAATGVVQIIWNEVGSATSNTSSVPVSATYLAVNESNTIAIFDHTGENASPRLGGLTAKVSNGYGTSTSLGSTDSTYGTLSGNARTDGGCYRATLTYPVVSVAITNDTGYDCSFDALHFDAAKIWAKGLDDVTVSISGDVDSSTLTNYSGLIQFNGVVGDYDDFDIDLTGLADRTLAHGETALIEFTFSNGDPSNSNAVSCVDNIALLGSGTDAASLTRVPGGAVSFGVAGSDTTTLSEIIRMSYEEGDAATNVVITGVTVSNVTHAGAFSTIGSFPQTLSVPGATNEIMTVEFDNTVANLAAGDVAYALVEIAWNEAGAGSRTFNLNVYASRPADVPEAGVVALFDTDFLIPDAAINGILGSFNEGIGLQEDKGSDDGDYGSLASPVAPTTISSWGVNGNNNVATLTVTNQSAGAIVLSSFNFDIGRQWDNSMEAFTLSVSGGVTADPALLVASGLTQVGNVGDFDDFDVALTNLADHTLATGESVVFTFTFVVKPGFEGNATSIDNVALMTVGAYSNWAVNQGLSLGVNDAPADNPDGDGRDNLMEYATNGDPLTADTVAMWQAADGGTNWFYHVYDERTDDPSLTFTLGARDNLVYLPDWSDADIEFVGESGESGGFKSVTNRTDLGSAEFIRLQVDQN